MPVQHILWKLHQVFVISRCVCTPHQFSKMYKSTYQCKNMIYFTCKAPTECRVMRITSGVIFDISIIVRNIWENAAVTYTLIRIVLHLKFKTPRCKCDLYLLSVASYCVVQKESWFRYLKEKCVRTIVLNSITRMLLWIKTHMCNYKHIQTAKNKPVNNVIENP